MNLVATEHNTKQIEELEHDELCQVAGGCPVCLVVAGKWILGTAGAAVVATAAVALVDGVIDGLTE